MKKSSLVAVFAHPDDEAFGPAGTLAIYAKTHDVYIVCVTDGSAGENHTDDSSRLLSEIRKNELENSASILGVEEVIFLNYKDGSLCNNSYHAVSDDLSIILDKIKPDTLLTYEARGVSGHLDHVAVSLITHYVFDKKDYVKKLLCYALLKDQTDKLRDYFIYVPHGIEPEEAHITINITSVWNTKLKAINAHKSQQKDISRLLENLKDEPYEEHFLIQEK